MTDFANDFLNRKRGLERKKIDFPREINDFRESTENHLKKKDSALQPSLWVPLKLALIVI